MFIMREKEEVREKGKGTQNEGSFLVRIVVFIAMIWIPDNFLGFSFVMFIL